jgi:hypothetical protein
MKKLMEFVLVFILILSLGCSKDDDSNNTIGEINARKISKLIKDASINNINVYEWELLSSPNGGSYSDWSWSFHNASSFKIESPYIIFQDSYYFDLNKLSRFDNLDQNLYLYFKY